VGVPLREEAVKSANPKESESQSDTIDRVMHEYKHGKRKSGAGAASPLGASRAAHPEGGTELAPLLLAA
jgi:hypothetical protein